MKKEFNNRVLQADEDPDSLLDALVYLQGRLSDAGVTVDDDEIIAQVLQGLPPTYSEIVTVLLTTVETIDLNKVRTDLRAFHKRLIKSETANKSDIKTSRQ